MHLVAEAMELRRELPRVEGNAEYAQWERWLLRMDELLRVSAVEEHFVQRKLAQWQSRRRTGARAQVRFQRQCRQALRCTLARQWTEKEYRKFSRRLADSVLLQWFCRIGRLEVVRVPGKSTLQRYEALVTEAEVRELVAELNRLAAQDAEGGAQPLGLAETAGIEVLWADSTCLKANIHFPVDWVLLRDAVRTLMKATRLIRAQGLKHRMEEPAVFLKRMNGLSMEMTQAGRRSGSMRARKRILRAMKRLTGTVRRHGQRYAALLAGRWAETPWTERQAARVRERIEGVLAQLPAAVRQAHERIIGRRAVPNGEKLLSLYEPEVRVIVRGKAGAEVEFGNTLYLAEQREGLIVDWQLLRAPSRGDAVLLEESLERVQATCGRYPLGVGADRGFDRRHTRRYLATRGIYNGICPRAPKDLRARLREEPFAEVQCRRAQTEARIGILQSAFLGRPLRNKGFAARARAVAWAVLAHNLWVLARLPQAQEAAQKRRRAA